MIKFELAVVAIEWAGFWLGRMPRTPYVVSYSLMNWSCVVWRGLALDKLVKGRIFASTYGNRRRDDRRDTC
jgi:hypothetical protein